MPPKLSCRRFAVQADGADGVEVYRPEDVALGYVGKTRSHRQRQRLFLRHQRRNAGAHFAEPCIPNCRP